MEYNNGNQKLSNKQEEDDNSEIDEEELQDQIIEEKYNLNDCSENDQKENSEENLDNEFLNEDEDEMKKDFEVNNLNKLNNQIDYNNATEFNLNLDNIKKGININHKQDFFNIFFDSGFYTNNRKIEVEKLIQFIKKDSNHGLTGLKNLKNTGFMNTILQCLSHTLDLSYYLISKSYVGDINKNSRSSKYKCFFIKVII